MSLTGISANRLELLQIAEAVAREKAIDKEIVIEAIEEAIQKGARARYGAEHDIRVSIDAKTGETTIKRVVTVVADDASFGETEEGLPAEEPPGILRLTAADISVWAITFLLTVFADLTVAVEVGMALAALLLILRISQTTTVSIVTPDYIEAGHVHSLQGKRVPDYVTILRIHGPFLFGTTDKLAEQTADLSHLAPIVILRLRNMTAIDATGLHALENLSDRLEKSGRKLILCGARHQPHQFLKQAEFVRHIGKDNIQPHVEAALRRAARMHAPAPDIVTS